MSAPRLGRPLLLGLIALCLALCAPFLYVHNRLMGGALAQADRFEAGIRQRLDGPAASDFTAVFTHPSGAMRWALDERPLEVDVGGEALYTSVEANAFIAARIVPDEARRGSPGTHPAAPIGVKALFLDGSVRLSWDPGPVNSVLAKTLDGSERELAWRIWRREAGDADLQLLATLPFSVTTWRDPSLPLARQTLSYEVWAVVLRTEPDGSQVLAGAERSAIAHADVPERFEIELLGGDGERARVRVVLPGGDAVVASAAVGEPIVAAGRPTRLVLASLEVQPSDRLTTRSRLRLKPDGSIVLDPESQRPRTTETQVLMSVDRLVAVLAHEDGTSRTLEVDLP